MEKITKESFKDYENSEELAIVKFGAEWCGPCRMLDEVLNQYSNDNTNIKIGQVNVDVESELSTKFEINSIPVTMFFKGGKLLERRTGYFQKSELSNFVDKYKN